MHSNTGSLTLGTFLVLNSWRKTQKRFCGDTKAVTLTLKILLFSESMHCLSCCKEKLLQSSYLETSFDYVSFFSTILNYNVRQLTLRKLCTHAPAMPVNTGNLHLFVILYWIFRVSKEEVFLFLTIYNTLIFYITVFFYDI